MPCLDEAETIATCIDKARDYLDHSGVRGEILVADNGSTDGSPEIAAQHGARVVRVDERGYGAALKAGISAAQGRFVIMGDADDSYDFSNLQPFVKKLRDGAELVMGNRFNGGIAPGAMPGLHNYLGNPVLRASAVCSSRLRSATSIAACAASIGRRSRGSASSRRAWSSRARWS